MTIILNRDTDAAVELHRILTASLTRRFGLAELLATALASEIALGMSEEAVGDSIHIPTRRTLQREQRNEQIRQDFRGNNIQELSRRFGLTCKQIRRIVSS